MLRRKLLLLVGSVVTLLLVAGIAAVVLMQGVLRDLEHVGSEVLAGAAAHSAIQLRLIEVESELKRAQTDQSAVDPGRIASVMDDITVQLDRLGALDTTANEGRPQVSVMRSLHGQLASQIQALGSQNGELDAAEMAAPLETITMFRQQLTPLETLLRSHTEAQQRSATTRFRWVALGLGLAFVVLLNASVMVLSKMATMILKPVDRLVEASRCLAREEFSHRVELDRHDEFGELANAYNSLARQLQTNELRKIETLQQVARTLNHELNNAISIIQLQLTLMARASSIDTSQTVRLKEIQSTLSRMSGTVSALTRVHRIVLTDYTTGVKMLDLEASIADGPIAASATASSAGPSPVSHADH